jgi:hypothetical protein
MCEALSTAVTDRSAGFISKPCEALVLHFCSPNAGNLRRAAAELMHLTKHYLATGISAFTPENSMVRPKSRLQISPCQHFLCYILPSFSIGF